MRRHITEFGHGGGQGAANGGGGNGGGLGLGRDEFHRFVAVTIGVPCAAREARALFDELLAKQQQQQQQGGGGGGALTATAFYGAFFGQRDRSWEEAKPNNSQTPPRQGASSPRAAPATMSVTANGLVVECDTGGLVGAAAAAAAEARAAAARHAIKRGVNDDSYTAEQARASERKEGGCDVRRNQTITSRQHPARVRRMVRNGAASRRDASSPVWGPTNPRTEVSRRDSSHPTTPLPLRARARAAVVGQALDVLRDHTKTKFKTVQARHPRALFEVLFPHACSLVGGGAARFYR